MKPYVDLTTLAYADLLALIEQMKNDERRTPNRGGVASR